MRTVVLETVNMNTAGVVSEVIPVIDGECYCLVGSFTLAGSTWAGTSSLSVEGSVAPLGDVDFASSWGVYTPATSLDTSGESFEIEVAGFTALRLKVVTGGENINNKVVLRFY